LGGFLHGGLGNSSPFPFPALRAERPEAVLFFVASTGSVTPNPFYVKGKGRSDLLMVPVFLPPSRKSLKATLPKIELNNPPVFSEDRPFLFGLPATQIGPVCSPGDETFFFAVPARTRRLFLSLPGSQLEMVGSPFLLQGRPGRGAFSPPAAPRIGLSPLCAG